MSEARSQLSLIRQIHLTFPPRGRDIGLLGAALVIGMVLAIGINLLRIPWARVLACISPSSGGSWPVS
jgi:hypothetical protein